LPGPFCLDVKDDQDDDEEKKAVKNYGSIKQDSVSLAGVSIIQINKIKV